jgi:1-deoxy-D-xylulose-5-phosphate reductoisomerase
MKNVTILGSTGSVGTQTLQVIRNNDDMRVVALAANTNIKKLEEQIREFHPEIVCVYQEKYAKQLKVLIADLSVKVVSGMEGLIDTAVYTKANIVITAFVGMIGIRPTLEAIKAGKHIGLANKETLVTAGHLVMSEARMRGVNILPVDSEHCAVFQVLKGENNRDIDKIILTASGGPFRGKTIEDMKTVTVERALKHPNWKMGPKITIDSATMINKGLEVIEAKWLFGVRLDQVQVVIQPQSVIHSMVQFVDGAIIAQIGTPDMKVPIQYALSYPNRRYLPGERLDFGKLSRLTFEDPDTKNFRGLELAYDACKQGGSMPTVFNAANEKAVAKFLNREIGFLDIVDMIEYCMGEHKAIENPTVEQILETEKMTYELIDSRW